MKRLGALLKTRAGWGVAFLLIGLAIGFGGGYWRAESSAGVLVAAVQSSLRPVQEMDLPYALVRPLLAYRTPEATTYGEYESLKADVQKDITSALAGKDVSRISVYFRDLDTARWIGINQNDAYYPASLLKVPVMMAYFKEAEKNSAVLTETLVYPGADLPALDTPSTLTVGRIYTVEELITHMIVDSDNGATSLLLAHIDSNVLNTTYTALGITSPGNNSAAYQIGNRTYSLFFRILYNATYLSPEYSEKALTLLSQSTFEDGLVAGLPSGITVAHKYGEHVITEMNQPVGVELHDCGVIYYPEHPYLLCVMTSARDTQTAEDVISTISETTYGAMKKQYVATTTPQ